MKYVPEIFQIFCEAEIPKNGAFVSPETYDLDTGLWAI